MLSIQQGIIYAIAIHSSSVQETENRYHLNFEATFEYYFILKIHLKYKLTLIAGSRIFNSLHSHVFPSSEGGKMDSCSRHFSFSVWRDTNMRVTHGKEQEIWNKRSWWRKRTRKEERETKRKRKCGNYLPGHQFNRID